MADHVFRGAAEQHVLETGSAMRRCHNEVRALLRRPRANLLAGMPDLERRSDVDSVPGFFFKQLAHLTALRLFRLLQSERQIVARILVARHEILQSNGMEQNEGGIELFRELFGIAEISCRRI